MVGVFVYGTIKTVISFLGAEQSWTRIIIGTPAAGLHRRAAGHRRPIGAPTSSGRAGTARAARPRHNGGMDDGAAPVLELTGATVRFGADAALDGVDFRHVPRRGPLAHGRERRRQVDADQGDHRRAPARRRASCGSTASRCASRSRTTPSGAGISTVYQEIDLLPNLSVAENIALGREPRRFGVIDWRADAARRARRARRPRARHRSRLDPRQRTPSPSSSSSRSRGRSRPTCGCSCSTSRRRASTSTRCAELFRVIRDLKQRGVAILFVSHFLDQVYEICDRVTVLRDGKLVGEYLTQRAAADRPRAEDARPQRRATCGTRPRADGADGRRDARSSAPAT